MTIKALEAEIAQLVAEIAPQLLSEPGLGPLTAARAAQGAATPPPTKGALLDELENFACVVPLARREASGLDRPADLVQAVPARGAAHGRAPVPRTSVTSAGVVRSMRHAWRGRPGCPDLTR
jgi:hypothetical protein